MPKPSAKTPAKIKRLLALHAEGASTREIGEVLKVSHGTVQCWIADAGLQPHAGHGSRSGRKRPANAAAGAMAGALEALETVTGATTPGDRAGAVAHLQARLRQISQMADQLAQGVPGGEASPAALTAIVRLERELASGIAELEPRAPAGAGETDPADITAAAEVRRKLAGLVEGVERSIKCQACGAHPFARGGA